MASWEEMQRVSQEALANPTPGDEWHEMYSWWLLVLVANNLTVTFWEGCGPGQIPDIGSVRTVTRQEWRKRMTYDSMPDKTVMICSSRGVNVNGILESFQARQED